MTFNLREHVLYCRREIFLCLSSCIHLPIVLSIIPSRNEGNAVKFAVLIVRPTPHWRKEDFARTRPLSGVYFNRAVLRGFKRAQRQRIDCNKFLRSCPPSWSISKSILPTCGEQAKPVALMRSLCAVLEDGDIFSYKERTQLQLRLWKCRADGIIRRFLNQFV